MKAGFGPIGITGLERFEAHGNVATVTAPCTPKARAVVVVIVVEHQADTHALERTEDFAHDATKYVKERV